MTKTAIPDWYCAAPASDSADLRASGRRNPLSVRRALARIGEALALELYGARTAESWMSRLELRARIVGIVALILGVTLLHDLHSLALALGLSLAIAWSTHVSAKKLWSFLLPALLFAAVVALPAVLNVITPGRPVLIIYRFAHDAEFLRWQLPDALSITAGGMSVAARLILRSLTCVVLAAVLVAGAEPPALINALRRLGMPKVFGMILAVMHRYLGLLLRTAGEIHLARLSRGVGAGSVRSEQRWVAAGIGILFSRTSRMAEQVRLAMLSRGYDGDLEVAGLPGFRVRDVVWLLGIAVVIFGLMAVDRLVH